MIVTLTGTEMAHALYAVALRFAVSNESGMKDGLCYRGKNKCFLLRLETELVGVCGEMVVAKQRGRWAVPPLNQFHRTPDVDGLEVRASRRDNASLILRNKDPDDRWYVLVVGTPPSMRIVGSIRGVDGKKPEFIRNPHEHQPAWFVPQDQLIKPNREETS